MHLTLFSQNFTRSSGTSATHSPLCTHVCCFVSERSGLSILCVCGGSFPLRVYCVEDMAGWAGFSDEEVTRIKQLKDPLIVEKPEKFGGAPSKNRSRQQLQRERALNQHCRKANGHKEVPLILPEQQLAKAKLNPPQAMEPPAPELRPKPVVKAAIRQLTAPEESHQKEMEESSDKVSCTFQESSVKELSAEQIKGVELRERSRLEQLQLEQRLMEEKNKRKKALLSKAIAERSKQTMAETMKLQHIQKELQSLDNLLSNGVNVLRNRIEQSSLEYYQAKFKYELEQDQNDKLSPSNQNDQLFRSNETLTICH